MATVYSYLTPAADPPCGLAISLTPGGGGSAATLSFLLVAWDDPDEKDITLARFYAQPATGNSLGGWGGGARTHYSRISKSIELNDIATITWTAPRRKPHHYALYYQAAASYDISNTGVKILPNTLVNGEIAGTATSLTLPARAAATTYYTGRDWIWFAPCDIDTVNHYMDVRGNWMGYFDPDGGTFLLEKQTGTTRQVSAKALYYFRGGEYTRFTVAAGPTAGTDYAAISVPSTGLFCPTSIAASQCQILFSPTLDIVHQSRESSTLDISGNVVSRSYINNSPDTMLQISIAYTDIFALPHLASPSRLDGGALYQLAKWKRWGCELDYIVNESTYATPHGTDRWRCVIEDVNDYQQPDMVDKDSIMLTLRASHFYPAYYDYGGWLITSVTAGAATCVIKGPLDKRLVAGARVWIINSTGNDGLWVISGVTAGTNSHTLTFTTNILDSTDDGYVTMADMT